jgi:acetoin utilization deacetylase AcuC-like enzyme
MKIVRSDRHKLHSPSKEFTVGQEMPCFEKVERVFYIEDALSLNNFNDYIEPHDYGLDPILRIHDHDYISFLQTAHDEWRKAGFEGDAFACSFNSQHHSAIKPNVIEGLMGFYLADTSLSITQTSWEAILCSAHIALTAFDVLKHKNLDSIFALCRPPGHHASKAIGAGYCFLNNVAIAAEHALQSGAKRIAILDIDYHHGNGTQDIFYDRDDVFFLSLHADPLIDYPYFLGHADEEGEGKGRSFNKNYPLPEGTEWNLYEHTLNDALQRIKEYQPDYLFVSLGVDTFEQDPISKFRLQNDDFIKIGQRLKSAGVPTIFVMEGGYAVADIGTNVVNILKGFSEQ